jgi:hypothetical protein
LLLGKSSKPSIEKSIVIPSIDNVTKSVAASLFAHSVPSTTLRLLLGNGAGGETGVCFGRSGGKPFELILPRPPYRQMAIDKLEAIPGDCPAKHRQENETEAKCKLPRFKLSDWPHVTTPPKFLD